MKNFNSFTWPKVYSQCICTRAQQNDPTLQWKSNRRETRWKTEQTLEKQRYPEKKKKRETLFSCGWLHGSILHVLRNARQVEWKNAGNHTVNLSLSFLSTFLEKTKESLHNLHDFALESNFTAALSFRPLWLFSSPKKYKRALPSKLLGCIFHLHCSRGFSLFSGLCFSFESTLVEI